MQENKNGITKNLRAQVKAFFADCNVGSYESRDRNMESCFRFADFLGETTLLIAEDCAKVYPKTKCFFRRTCLMDKEVKKEVPVPQKTVIKIGRTEYEVYEFYSEKYTLFDKLLRLMMKDLDKRN